MHSSVLSKVHFGPYHNDLSLLQPGDTQSMQFCSNDDGPFYLSDDEKIKQKYDEKTGKTKTRELTKAELKPKLIQAGVADPRGSKKQLQEHCQRLNLPISELVPVVMEGWNMKPKGALQVLYERGWIDVSKVMLYTANGVKDVRLAQNDVTGCSFSIKSLMKLQSDFINEVTLLQHHIQKLGASVDRSPKCHPELAGEGIEYVWALAKLRYRRAPMNKKRNKENFIKLVRECTNSFDALNICRIRSCSKRARAYMKLYKVVSDLEKDGSIMEKKHSTLESTIKLYLKLKKISKSHRSVVDLQQKDVMEIENMVPVIDDTNHQSDLEVKVKEETIGLLVKRMNSM